MAWFTVVGHQDVLHTESVESWVVKCTQHGAKDLSVSPPNATPQPHDIAVVLVESLVAVEGHKRVQREIAFCHHCESIGCGHDIAEETTYADDASKVADVQLLENCCPQLIGETLNETFAVPVVKVRNGGSV